MPVNSVATAATAGPATIGAAASTAAGPLGGFEALLAALFGAQAEGATAMANPFQGSAGDADATKDEAPSGDASTADPTAAAQSLMAAFVAPIVTPVVTQPVASGETTDGAAPTTQAAAPVVDLFAKPGDAATPPPPGGEAKATTAATPIVRDATQAITKAAGKDDPLMAALAPPAAPPTPQPTTAAEPTAPTAPVTTQLADATAQAATALPPQAAAVTAPKPDAGAKQDAATKPVANPAVEGVEGEIQAPDAVKAVASAAKAAQSAGEPGVRKHEVEVAPPQAQDAKTSPDASVTRAPDAPAQTASTSHAPLAHAASLRGAPETVATLAAQILKKLDSKTTRFDMELEPYGMGKVDVRLEIGAQGRLTAAMAFENPQSAQELRSRASELKGALEQAGFDVMDGLSFDVADNPGGGANQNNSAQDQARDAPSRGRAFLAALQNASGADAPSLVNLSYARLRAGGVDVKI